ncbi:unnamed protein product [Phaedon cochleariae]|uniref:Ionotropic glutamate receptor C-terminal domain-containing protein n=1 Tax=Phaedon cochleariae TaxID=80249 RepID=A0A9P0DJR1_PHACE|nr:unnamed protein product [Phaedon cochleariae]
MGTVLKICYVVTNNDTLNHLEDYRNIHIDPIPKLSWKLVNHALMTILNASSIIDFKSTWGYRNSTTNIFTGMIGDVQTGKADLGGTPCFFTADRMDILEFFAPSAPTHMRFIFRAPPLSYTTNIFTLPFHTYVWYSIFLLLGIIFFVTYVIVKWEWKDPVFRRKIEEMQEISATPMPINATFVDVFMMEMGAITQQGTDSEPKSNSGRIVTICTFIALMFIYTSYSANVVALLQSTTDSIRTLEDLLNSRISLGFDDVVYIHHYIKTIEEPVRKAIYQQKIAPKGEKPHFMNLEEGMSRVRKGFFAFHAELSTGYKVVADTFQEHEKCGLKDIEYFTTLTAPWFTMRKRSPYKELLKVSFQKFHESGTKNREIGRLYIKKPICHNKGSSFGSAGFLDCYAAFLIFGIGVGCSLTVFLLEILSIKYLENRRKI